MKKQIALLPAVQGAYYLVTGLWPVIDIDSFMLVTGPKDDLWLVKMVGLLAASAALTLLYYAIRGYRAGSGAGDIEDAGSKTDTGGRADGAPLLGLSTAFSFLSVDVYYVLARVIPPVYLADAVIQVILIGWWVINVRAGASGRT